MQGGRDKAAFVTFVISDLDLGEEDTLGETGGAGGGGDGEKPPLALVKADPSFQLNTELWGCRAFTLTFDF